MTQKETKFNCGSPKIEYVKIVSDRNIINFHDMTNSFKTGFCASLIELIRSLLSYTVIQNCSLLLLLMLITSCNGHDKATERLNETKTNPVAFPESSLPVEDPSFTMSKDTISTHGPRSITRNVLQDKNGKYWFATWEGVVSFDGKRFTNVTLKEGLRRFHVFSILEDKMGNLWFGTIGGGVYRYDGKSFTYFTTRDGLASNVILCMLEDNFGNIWFGTQDGVSRYDWKTFTNFTTLDGLSSNFISSIVQAKTGKLWFGTDGGVCCFDPSASPRADGKFFTNFTNEKGLPFFIGSVQLLKIKPGTFGLAVPTVCAAITLRLRWVQVENPMPILQMLLIVFLKIKQEIFG